MFRRHRIFRILPVGLLLLSFSSCAQTDCCGVADCGPVGCGPVGCESGGCGLPLRSCGLRGRCCVGGACANGGQMCERCCWAMTGWAWRRSNAIPETLPLGSTVRAHDQVMQTNAEAADFIFHRHDFVAQTAHLTPDAKDKIVEVASRMRSAPFPVIVERSENNTNPELDALRRNIVATILTDMGNADAQQRTVVATPYSPGYIGRRAEFMYFQHVGGGGLNNNNNGGGFGGGAGFGGGGFGGGGGF